MSERRNTDPLEIAVHIIIVLLGIIVLAFAYDFKDVFWQSLLVNIGSSLVIVTVLFAIFEAFRRRHDEREQQVLQSGKSPDNSPMHSESEADELVITLRKKQHSPVITSLSKLGD